MQNWAVANFRILPDETSDEVFEHVRTVVNDSRVEYEENGVKSEPSVVSDTESHDFKTLQRTIREISPNVVVTTDSRRYEGITENTFRCIPARMTSEDLRRPHGINERIGIENYVEIIRFFIQQIRNSGG